MNEVFNGSFDKNGQTGAFMRIMFQKSVRTNRLAMFGSQNLEIIIIKKMVQQIGVSCRPAKPNIQNSCVFQEISPRL